MNGDDVVAVVMCDIKVHYSDLDTDFQAYVLNLETQNKAMEQNLDSAQEYIEKLLIVTEKAKPFIDSCICDEPCACRELVAALEALGVE